MNLIISINSWFKSKVQYSQLLPMRYVRSSFRNQCATRATFCVFTQPTPQCTAVSQQSLRIACTVSMQLKPAHATIIICSWSIPDVCRRPLFKCDTVGLMWNVRGSDVKCHCKSDVKCYEVWCENVTGSLMWNVRRSHCRVAFTWEVNSVRLHKSDNLPQQFNFNANTNTNTNTNRKYNSACLHKSENLPQQFNSN